MADTPWDAACEAFEAEMWPKGPAHGSGSGIWAKHKDRLRDAAQRRDTRGRKVGARAGNGRYARRAKLLELSERALTPTGDHHVVPGGYCLDCQGQHIGEWLAASSGPAKEPPPDLDTAVESLLVAIADLGRYEYERPTTGGVAARLWTVFDRAGELRALRHGSEPIAKTGEGE